MASTMDPGIQHDKQPRVDTRSDTEIGVENLRREKRSKQQRGNFGSASAEDILVANPASPEPQNCSLEISLPINLSVQSLAHTQNLQAGHLSILATKWMNSSQLQKMVHEEGLVYLKGKFTAPEQVQIDDAIDSFRSRMGMTDEDILGIIFAKDKEKSKLFWPEIASAVPQRPVKAVYEFVRRNRHPLSNSGNWMLSDDNALLEVLNNMGANKDWSVVAKEVGRTAADCRDRYRNHLKHRDVRVSGKWSQAEEAELVEIITKFWPEKQINNKLFWTRVSSQMGHKRTRQQCESKWNDSLARKLKDKNRRWTAQESRILVHKVNSLNVQDETLISWKSLSHPGSGLEPWSGRNLLHRWTKLKAGVADSEEKSHQEIMKALVERFKDHSASCDSSTIQVSITANDNM